MKTMQKRYKTTQTTIQKRKYCDDHRLAIFNYIYKKKGEAPVRLNPVDMKTAISNINIKLDIHLEHLQ